MPPRAVSSTATRPAGSAGCSARFAGRGSRRHRSGDRPGRCRRCRSSDLFASLRSNVRDQPRGRRLAVHAGDGDDRNAAGFAPRKSRSTIASPTGARRAAGRLQVHPQARRSVDFDDHAALLLQRPADVVGDDVDAGDVQADHARRVDRRAPRPPDARGRSRRRRSRRCSGWHCGESILRSPACGIDWGVVPLAGQHRQRNRVERDLRQARGVVFAAARVLLTISTSSWIE